MTGEGDAGTVPQEVGSDISILMKSRIWVGVRSRDPRECFDLAFGTRKFRPNTRLFWIMKYA